MIPVLIIGKSGSGKSASLRNLDPERSIVVNVLGKALPFRSKLKTVQVADYGLISQSIGKAKYDVYVIDDAGYLITNEFMASHASTGAGNAVFSLYNQMADNFWTLIRNIQKNPAPSRVYLLMHEDKTDLGDIKPKTIGKLLDEKVCLEGMFTICLRATLDGGRHIFRTQTDGWDISKSPMGMFDSETIDNDLAFVDKAICEYYEIGGIKND